MRNNISLLAWIFWVRCPRTIGSKVLATFVADDEAEFWLQASQSSLSAIWDTAEDDVDAQLLKE
jgi:hypothetical protein